MSDMGWDNNLKMIIMGDAEYRDYVQIHTQDAPYLNKAIEDYDLIEAICGNDQATGRRAVDFENPIGTQMDYNMEQEATPPTEQWHDLSSGETYVPGNASPFNQSQAETSEPMLRTNPTQRRKEKGKRKASADSDALHELTTTIKDAFESIKSSRTLSFARELSEECMKMQEYGYSTRQIGALYKYLMADDARARTFFGMCEELRKDFANDFFDSFGRDL